MPKFILFILSGLIYLIPFAQQPISIEKKKDSLRALLQSARPDTARIRILYELSLLLHRTELDEKLLQYASESLTLSQKENYPWGMGAAYYVKGFYAFAIRNHEQALSDIARAEKIMKEAGDKKNAGICTYLLANIHFDLGDYTGSVKNGLDALAAWQTAGYRDLNGSCHYDLAVAYARLGNNSKAIEHAYKALKASEALNDQKVVAQSLHLIGALYYGFGDYENAMKNFQAATGIYKKLGNRYDFAQNNNMIGEVLLEQGNLTGAYNQFYQSLKIYEEPGAPAWGIPWGYSNLGSVYEKQADSALAAGNKIWASAKYREALNSFTLSLQKFEEIKDMAAVAEQKIFIGKTYFKTGQMAAAKKFLLEGLSIAGRFGEKLNLMPSYLYLSQIDSAEGNLEKAYEHYKLYTRYRDSMFNRESSQRLSIYKVQYEFEKKEQELKLLTAENKLQSALADKQNQRKWFAWIMAGLILLLSAAGFYRYRRNSRIRSEQKLLKDRLAISQDLHDNIGSTLSSISVYSQVAKLQAEKTGKADLNELLEKIGSTSTEMVTEMSDIVWAINPRNDSMEKIIQRMESFARPLAAARDIRFELRYDEQLQSLHLSMNKRKNFYLIFKEAVNNAVKYSAASLLIVDIHTTRNMLVLSVQDNGIGFNTEAELTAHHSSLSGNGLINMQERAAEFNAVLKIQSSPGNGTIITLELPVN
ncbi:MAG TPA: tetratricopeptide repeat protein [Ferruginibacter sp.]|nr:hypothetical protein [Chitinophagaceae bacterium]HRI23712.1 tetratricopeptide repeat protein [Ferruginibacter sp.]